MPSIPSRCRAENQPVIRPAHKSLRHLCEFGTTRREMTTMCEGVLRCLLLLQEWRPTDALKYITRSMRTREIFHITFQVLDAFHYIFSNRTMGKYFELFVVKIPLENFWIISSNFMFQEEGVMIEVRFEPVWNNEWVEIWQKKTYSLVKCDKSRFLKGSRASSR